MRAAGFGLVVLLCVMTGGVRPSGQVRPCRHDRSETDADRTRRQQAIELAHRINEAQDMARRFGPRGDRNRYAPIDQLSNLPPAPSGFTVQHHTDGATYAFSIKDDLDPCRYAIFSDQSGDLYEGVPSGGQPRLRLLSQR